MIEYYIIESTSSVNLQNLVNEALQQGFELQGGVCYSNANLDYKRVYCQAVIKRIIEQE